MKLRELERESIRSFVQDCANKGYLSGRILDYGCGNQPYRGIVEAAGGTYFGYDSPTNPGSVITEESAPSLVNMELWPDSEEWDAILCTQVIQYAWWRAASPFEGEEIGFLFKFKEWMPPNGYLVMTGPTNWPVVENADRVRFTKEGILQELVEAGFVEVEVGYRAEVHFEGVAWPTGWWAVARA